MLPQNKLAELAGASLFRHLDAAALAELLPALDEKFLAGGETLFHAGDHGDSMYVVLSGRLRASVESDGATAAAIREIARGESVGELALLTGKPRSATVRAIRDSELVRLSRASFEAALQNYPQLLGQLAVEIAGRQAQGGEPSPGRRNIRTLALLPLTAELSLGDFVRALIDALKPLGPALQLDSQRLRAELSEAGGDSGADGRLTAHLSALENRYRFVVYQADVGPSPWTQRCLRQADIILAISRGDGAADQKTIRQFENFFASNAITTAVEAVLLHDREFDAHCASGHDALGAATRHHVVASAPADMARLARLITGNAIGLVLSGGGARGFAHIGVLRALDERNIQIDCIGGTSMGAVIAAQFALGWDWRTMARVNREEWPRCQPQKNYTLPIVALNSARRMDQMLLRMLGDGEIQNLRSQFFCVSTNLTTARAKIHRSGALWKAVRASVSIPGIGPPAIENGEILVDGGLVDNLPVEAMKKICQGRVYAVDVSEQTEFRSKLKESYTVSGWNLLWQRLNPFAERADIPNILNTLYRTTTVAGVAAVDGAKSHADLCFEPPVSHFGVFDWRGVEAIIEVGYRYALNKLDEIALTQPTALAQDRAAGLE